MFQRHLILPSRHRLWGVRVTGPHHGLSGSPQPRRVAGEGVPAGTTVVGVRPLACDATLEALARAPWEWRVLGGSLGATRRDVDHRGRRSGRVETGGVDEATTAPRLTTERRLRCRRRDLGLRRQRGCSRARMTDLFKE